MKQTSIRCIIALLGLLLCVLPACAPGPSTAAPSPTPLPATSTPVAATATAAPAPTLTPALEPTPTNTPWAASIEALPVSAGQIDALLPAGGQGQMVSIGYQELARLIQDAADALGIGVQDLLEIPAVEGQINAWQIGEEDGTTEITLTTWPTQIGDQENHQTVHQAGLVFYTGRLETGQIEVLDITVSVQDGQEAYVTVINGQLQVVVLKADEQGNRQVVEMRPLSTTSIKLEGAVDLDNINTAMFIRALADGEKVARDLGTDLRREGSEIQVVALKNGAAAEVEIGGDGGSGGEKQWVIWDQGAAEGEDGQDGPPSAGPVLRVLPDAERNYAAGVITWTDPMGNKFKFDGGTITALELVKIIPQEQWPEWVKQNRTNITPRYVEITLDGGGRQQRADYYSGERLLYSRVLTLDQDNKVIQNEIIWPPELSTDDPNVSLKQKWPELFQVHTANTDFWLPFDPNEVWRMDTTGYKASIIIQFTPNGTPNVFRYAFQEKGQGSLVPPTTQTDYTIVPDSLPDTDSITIYKIDTNQRQHTRDNPNLKYFVPFSRAEARIHQDRATAGDVLVVSEHLDFVISCGGDHRYTGINLPAYFDSSSEAFVY